MAPSKKVLATVSNGQLPSFCRIGRGGCNSLALGFTGGSCDENKMVNMGRIGKLNKKIIRNINNKERHLKS